jgi:hypothetical protein
MFVRSTFFIGTFLCSDYKRYTSPFQLFLCIRTRTNESDILYERNLKI